MDDPTPNLGDTITFTVTLTNNGPSPATNVQVTDLLPTGLTLVMATPNEGSYDAATGVWSVGTVALGPHTLTLQAARGQPEQHQTNTASITNSDQFDPNPGNNAASVTETPQQADLVVGKTVSNPTPNVGETITYTIRVTNAGPNNATGVTIEDILPAAISYQSSQATQGSYDPGTGTWTVGTVANAVTEILTIATVLR